MKKRNEDMNFDNDEDALVFINRLLERLHQAGHANNGSKIEIVYVASGGQHVEKQYISLTPNPSPLRATLLPSGGRKGEGNLKGGEKGKKIALPEALSTDEAMVLWEKAQAAGWIDGNYLPLISRTQAALLADAMAERLGIKEKWKVFEAFWHRKYMRSDYNLALTQQQTYEFQDELKQQFG